MEPSKHSLDASEQPVTEEWEAAAWVYFVWVVIGYRVYCKIGYSTNPGSRFNQITVGIPERPYRIHLLPCLSVEQAQLFERMLIDHLRGLRSKAKGEWFTHPNVTRLNRLVGEKLGVILAVFQTFGYENGLDRIDLDGKQPVLSDNGYISHLIE